MWLWIPGETGWSAATYEEVNVAGNPTKKYSALDFVGIETVSAPVNATTMTHVHLDVWSADNTNFGIKLVDFGANGVFGGGDDVEHQVNFAAPAKGVWVSYNIPLSDFTALTTRAHLAQYILVGQPSGATTVWIDNIYFYNDGRKRWQPDRLQPRPRRLHGMPPMWFRFTVMPILPSPLIILTPDGAEVLQLHKFR
ncbi:MAG: hypothetical protein MZV63_01695 [Marinilabiliales bacterium]|nr:hypothetical protein [Marinilabiliales bacterium]